MPACRLPGDAGYNLGRGGWSRLQANSGVQGPFPGSFPLILTSIGLAREAREGALSVQMGLCGCDWRSPKEMGGCRGALLLVTHDSPGTS